MRGLNERRQQLEAIQEHEDLRTYSNYVSTVKANWTSVHKVRKHITQFQQRLIAIGES